MNDEEMAASARISAHVNRQYCLEFAEEISEIYNYFSPMCASIEFDIYQTQTAGSKPYSTGYIKSYPMWIWQIEMGVLALMHPQFLGSWRKFQANATSKIKATFLQSDFRDHYERGLPIPAVFQYKIQWGFKGILMEQLCRFSLKELAEMFPAFVLQKFLLTWGI